MLSAGARVELGVDCSQSRTSRGPTLLFAAEAIGVEAGVRGKLLTDLSAVSVTKNARLVVVHENRHAGCRLAANIAAAIVVDHVGHLCPLNGRLVDAENRNLYNFSVGRGNQRRHRRRGDFPPRDGHDVGGPTDGHDRRRNARSRRALDRRLGAQHSPKRSRESGNSAAESLLADIHRNATTRAAAL